MISVLHCLSNSGAGGAQQVVYQLVKTLLRRQPDISHSVALPAGGIYVERFRALGVNVAGMNLDSLSLRVGAQIRSLIRSRAFSVVHSHGKGAGIHARLLSPGGRALHRVHSFHGVHPPAHAVSSRLYVGLERHLAAMTDVFVAVGQDEARDIRLLTGAEERRIEVIANIADRQAVRAAAEKPLVAFLEDRLRQVEGAFIISMIARPDPLKNHDLAFKAAALALRRRPSLVFVFAGLPESDSRFAALSALFPRHTFAVPSLANAAPLIKRSDAVLLTSRKEAGPIVVLEAFCLGRPVVATDVPGIRGQVVHGETGLLCAETPEAVADCLIALAADRGLYGTLREGATRTGDAMDIEAWSQQYARLYVEGADRQCPA